MTVKHFVAKSMHVGLTIEPCAVTPWAPLPQPSTVAYVPVVLPDDHQVKRQVEQTLNPIEKRRFQALYREAQRNGYGVRPATRLALRRLSAEATERIDRAVAIAKG